MGRAILEQLEKAYNALGVDGNDTISNSEFVMKNKDDKKGADIALWIEAIEAYDRHNGSFQTLENNNRERKAEGTQDGEAPRVETRERWEPRPMCFENRQHVRFHARLDEPPIEKWAIIIPISETGMTNLDYTVKGMMANMDVIHELKMELGEVCRAKRKKLNIYFLCVHDSSINCRSSISTLASSVLTDGNRNHRKKLYEAAMLVGSDMEKLGLYQIAFPAF